MAARLGEICSLRVALLGLRTFENLGSAVGPAASSYTRGLPLPLPLRFLFEL